jgi:hypothetical protein
MKHATGIVALSFLACLIVAAPASARGIRTDTGNAGWDTCSAAAPCATLPDGLSFNPFGTDPTAAPSPNSLRGGLAVFAVPPSNPDTDPAQGPDAQSPTCAPDGCSSNPSSWKTPVSGAAYGYAGGAQVMFFDLTTSALETVYGPNLNNSGDDPVVLGNALPASSKAPMTAWEVEFNYALTTHPTFASLEFGGNIYTASGDTLSPKNLNEFVFYGDTLHAPNGWTETSATVSAPEIDPASAIAGLTLLAGCMAVLRGGRRTLHVSG